MRISDKALVVVGISCSSMSLVVAWPIFDMALVVEIMSRVFFFFLYHGGSLNLIFYFDEASVRVLVISKSSFKTLVAGYFDLYIYLTRLSWELWGFTGVWLSLGAANLNTHWTPINLACSLTLRNNWCEKRNCLLIPTTISLDEQKCNKYTKIHNTKHMQLLPCVNS